MNSFQLQCFLAVAETLNFARASEMMNITQPSITHQIQALETELNTKLFHRTTRTVKITPAGEAMLLDAQNIVLITNRIKKRYETSFDPEIETFSLGCHGFSHLFILPEILRKLSHLHPSVRPDLQVVPFKHLYRLLEEETVSAIIAFQESNKNKAPGKYKELKKVPVVAVCTKESLLADKTECSWETLKQEKLIFNNPIKCPSVIVQLQNRLLENHTPEEIYYSESPEVAMTLVKSGFGITLLPQSLVPNDSEIVQIFVKEAESISLGIYYKSVTANPVLKDFINIAKELYAKCQ